jgi:hypothetical protein
MRENLVKQSISAYKIHENSAEGVFLLEETNAGAAGLPENQVNHQQDFRLKASHFRRESKCV